MIVYFYAMFYYDSAYIKFKWVGLCAKPLYRLFSNF